MPPRLSFAASCFAAIAMLSATAAVPGEAIAQDNALAIDQTTEGEVVAGGPAAATTTEDSEKPPRGPLYLNLRYNEDFSYLDGPDGSYQKDFFDPIKWIHLTDDLTLSIGGEFRARLEAETNRAFGATEPAQDTYFLHRYRLHTDLRYRKSFRVFFEAISAYIEDRDLAQLATHENRWDIHQLFFDIRPLGEEVPLTLRIGRQEMVLGNERLVSPLAWANTRRRFDAAALVYNHEDFDLTAFYGRAVPPTPAEGLHRKWDVYREEAHFYGIYTTCKAIEDHFFDLYAFGLNDNGDLRNANGRAGDLSIYTIGGRAGGKTGPYDYEGELAGQWGTWAGDNVHAWMAAVDGGYTFKECPATPRIGVGFDYGSGDDSPNDGSHDTFNQLFPLGHKYLGAMDLFGRQNVLATNVNLTAKPCEQVTTKLAWYTFWNDDKRDALYNAGGAAVRRDATGNSGHDIGNELDLTIKYQMDVHQSFLFGYSHFWGVNYIRSSGADRDADFMYVQYAYTF